MRISRLLRTLLRSARQTSDTGNGPKNIKVSSRLDLEAVKRLSRRPFPFENEHRQFWSDPYISAHVLSAHTDEDSDAGSRRRDIIEASSTWIAEQWDRYTRDPPRNPERPQDAPRLLDLGCGPGLYALRFQDLGFTVTGLDISPASIAYAKRFSVRTADRAEFRQTNYLNLDTSETYHVATCIYGGMGTISDHSQADLMERVYRALKPGGLFMFDVFTREYADQERLADGWFSVGKQGFWSPHPYLVLETSFLYPELSAFADSYTLLFKNGNADRFLVWHRFYSREEIRTATEVAGFEVLSLYSDLCGTPQYSGSLWIGVVARKPLRE